MSKQFISIYKDINENTLELRIYKNILDPVVSVNLKEAPLVESKSLENHFVGGLITTTLDFTLYGTAAEPLIDLADSEVTEYKVTLKKNGTNIYFGYLVNGVYEVDFSEVENFPVQFAATDFKPLDSTKSVANLNLNLIALKDMLSATCIAKDFPEELVSITATTIPDSEQYGAQAVNPNFKIGCVASVFAEKFNVADEKGDGISDFDLIDKMAKALGYIIVQRNGIKIVEINRLFEYNDTLTVPFSELSSSTFTPTSSINAATSVSIPSKIAWSDGSQVLSLTEKYDRIRIQPRFKFKKNYYKMDSLGVDEDNYKRLINEGEQLYYYKDDSIKLTAKSIGKNEYNNEVSGDATICLLEEENEQKENSYNIVAFNKSNTFTDKVVFTPNNSYNYTPESSTAGIVRVKFKVWAKANRKNDHLVGHIELRDVDGKVIESQQYRLKEVSKNYLKECTVLNEYKAFHHDKYNDEQQKDFIFILPFATKLQNLIVAISKPWATESNINLLVTDAFAISDVKVEFVKATGRNIYETFSEKTPEELVIETTSTPNDFKNELSIDFDYTLLGKTSYQLVTNMLYVKTQTDIRNFKRASTSRVNRLQVDNWGMYEDQRSDELYKQLSKRRLKLSVSVVDSSLLDYNTVYTINTLPNKTFVLTSYSTDTEDDKSNIVLEQII